MKSKIYTIETKEINGISFFSLKLLAIVNKPFRRFELVRAITKGHRIKT